MGDRFHAAVDSRPWISTTFSLLSALCLPSSTSTKRPEIKTDLRALAALAATLVVWPLVSGDIRAHWYTPTREGGKTRTHVGSKTLGR